MVVDAVISLSFSAIAAVMLFLYGLSAFSEEVTRLGGERLRRFLAYVTRVDWLSAVVGAIVTAIVQSSSAVTSMAVGLADRKALSTRGCVGIMLGANVGTTLTAWLIALKVAGLGPVFVTLGGLWSLGAPRAYRPYGKAVFYFGLIFLALDLIAQALHQWGTQHATEWLPLLASPAAALLFGLVVSAAVQSSSVVSGLAVLAVTEQILPGEAAVWVVAGANMGTTSTALLAGASLGTVARKLAWINTLFNAMGVVIFATVLQPAVSAILNSGLSAGEQVAMVHTLFNLTASALALLLLPRLWPWLERWLSRSDVH